MTYDKIIAGTCLSFALAFIPTQDAAATVCTPSTDDLGDNLIAQRWGCEQSRINDMWTRFNMQPASWDDGFGYEDPCNEATPLKRLFNALQLMAYGVTAAPVCETDDANVAKWAYCWSGNALDQTHAACGDGTYYAYTSFGLFGSSATYYNDFFYQENVIERAATVFHEARHAQGWCQHNLTGCNAGSNCENSWTDGCHGFGSGSGGGAWKFSVQFTRWFATTARTGWTNASLRSSAITTANAILQQRFVEDPCFLLDSNGNTYATC